jgi:hypothetical protein
MRTRSWQEENRSSEDLSGVQAPEKALEREHACAFHVELLTPAVHDVALRGNAGDKGVDALLVLAAVAAAVLALRLLRIQVLLPVPLGPNKKNDESNEAGRARVESSSPNLPSMWLLCQQLSNTTPVAAAGQLSAGSDRSDPLRSPLPFIPSHPVQGSAEEELLLEVDAAVVAPALHAQQQ